MNFVESDCSVWNAHLMEFDRDRRIHQAELDSAHCGTSTIFVP